MKTVILNGKPFEFDDSATYLDFHVSGGKPILERHDGNFILRLAEVEERLGRPVWNWAFAEAFKLWLRWVHEAPRKRFYRDMLRAGKIVANNEFFFPEEGGDEIIDGLENMGRVALRVLEQYGETGVRPIEHDDPVKPTSEAEVLGYKP